VAFVQHVHGSLHGRFSHTFVTRASTSTSRYESPDR